MPPFENLTNPLIKIAQNLTQKVDIESSIKLVSTGISTSDSNKQYSEYKNQSNLSEINKNRGVLVFGQSTYGSEGQAIRSVEDPTKKDKEFENLAYPPDLGNRKFYMRLDFKKYERPSPVVQGDISTLHSICLPIPTELNDNYKIDYSDYDGEIAAAVMNSLATNQGVTAAAAVRPLVDFASRTNIGKSIVNIAAQNLAAALNPNKSILFNSPEFKRYNFSWTFAPNNLKESEVIRRIIRKIKASALPTYVKTKNTSGNAAVDYNIFNYPNMVKVYLYPWASLGSRLRAAQSQANEMFQTKHCVIDSISINYSPENNISFFSDGENAPTFIQLSISLIEIELFTGEDFGRQGSEIDLTEILGNANEIDTEIDPKPQPQGQ